MRHLLICEG